MSAFLRRFFLGFLPAFFLLLLREILLRFRLTHLKHFLLYFVFVAELIFCLAAGLGVPATGAKVAICVSTTLKRWQQVRYRGGTLRAQNLVGS